MRERLKDFGKTVASSLSLPKKWERSLYLQNMCVEADGQAMNPNVLMYIYILKVFKGGSGDGGDLEGSTHVLLCLCTACI